MSDYLPSRCVVMGKTGVGKSSFCNLMKKTRTCVASTSGTSVTTKPQKVELKFDMKDNEFIDFPGYFDTCRSDEEIFVYAINIGSRFTDEIKHTLLKVKDPFEFEVFKFMVIIFTCKNNLSHSNLSPEQYMKNFR